MLARDLDEINVRILDIIEDLDEYRLAPAQRRMLLHQSVSIACEIAEERAREAQAVVESLGIFNQDRGARP